MLEGIAALVNQDPGLDPPFDTEGAANCSAVEDPTYLNDLQVGGRRCLLL